MSAGLYGGKGLLDEEGGLKLRAATHIGKADPLGAAPRHAFDHNTTIGHANHFRVTQAGIARSSACFTLATTVAHAAIATVAIVTDNGTDAVGTDAQFNVLRERRRGKTGAAGSKSQR
ncbi:hypothetical protein BJF93_14445 [Xaviernesmea oryzae]|uniref:Uncharacterized protein n=1 Tax=Xaviernesmea oryzae TaxID=464029 RepID=A0A1Q9AXK1_9HYPH|nr:hypothetical protein BJF93_14445 [Xaviernesmea oryzae]SEK30310.1 hypothetical protein SAMN04487976_101333 [Xaviernesmea oryzae]